MPATPGFTLTGLLQNIVGAPIIGARVRVTLCNFGLSDPTIPGTSIMAEIEKILAPDDTGVVDEDFWGNDVISPTGTFYLVEIIDSRRNIVWAQNFQFNGGGGDLSTMTPYNPTPPSGAAALAYLLCNVVTAGTVYAAPGTVIMAFVDGVPQRPTIDFNGVGTSTVTLLYTADPADTVYALCLVPSGTSAIDYVNVTTTGTVPGNSYTAPGPVIMVFINGISQRPTLDFTGVGTTLISLNFMTSPGDTVYALYSL